MIHAWLSLHALITRLLGEGRMGAISREKEERILALGSLERESLAHNEEFWLQHTYILPRCNYQNALRLKRVYTDTTD